MADEPMRLAVLRIGDRSSIPRRGGSEGALLLPRRLRPHPDQGRVDGLLAVDDRVEHGPHGVLRAVPRGEGDARGDVGLGYVEGGKEPATGDQREALDALGILDGEVRRCLCALRVATQEQLVESERIREVPHELRPREEPAHRPMLLPRVGATETGPVRRDHPESLRGERGKHEAPARSTRRSGKASVQQHDCRAVRGAGLDEVRPGTGAEFDVRPLGRPVLGVRHESPRQFRRMWRLSGPAPR